MINLALMILMFALNGFDCGSGSGSSGEHNNPLPDKRPDKLQITYGISGGMRYWSHSLFISADSCYSETNDGGAISKVYFKMTPEELDKLYSVFVDNKFWKIKTREEMIYDRGGEMIQLSWGDGKYANVSDAGMSLIVDSWKNEWNACLSALQNVEGEKVNAQQKDFEIRLDKSFFGKKVYVNVQEKVIVSQEKALEATGDYVSNTVKLLPGIHRLNMGWDQKNFQNITISADSSKGIILSLKNSEFKTELIK